MSQLESIELKAFVPAKDFDLSKSFYLDLGFEIPWSSEDLAYVRHGETSFLLQHYSVEELAHHFMMHLLVTDVESWWAMVEEKGTVEKYGSSMTPIQNQPWGMKEFTLTDPSGVLWRIAQNI